MNDTQVWVQLELEGVEAKGQSLPDGFQRSFLEAPELKESPQALQAACPLNSIRFGSRKKPPGEFCSLEVLRLVFEIDADRMCRRPCADITEMLQAEKLNQKSGKSQK